MVSYTDPATTVPYVNGSSYDVVYNPPAASRIFKANKWRSVSQTLELVNTSSEAAYGVPVLEDYILDPKRTQDLWQLRGPLDDDIVDGMPIRPTMNVTELQKLIFRPAGATGVEFYDDKLGPRNDQKLLKGSASYDLPSLFAPARFGDLQNCQVRAGRTLPLTADGLLVTDVITTVLPTGTTPATRLNLNQAERHPLPHHLDSKSHEVRRFVENTVDFSKGMNIIRMSNITPGFKFKQATLVYNEYVYNDERQILNHGRLSSYTDSGYRRMLSNRRRPYSELSGEGPQRPPRIVTPNKHIRFV